MPVEDDSQLREILERETVAVVGCSSTPGKDAHDIPEYLLDHGYNVIPVNPFADEIFGRKAYDSLTEIEADIDIVDIFRPSEEVPDIVEAALERDDGAVIWMQLGITHDEAAETAENAGRMVVQDHCIKQEHERLVA